MIRLQTGDIMFTAPSTELGHIITKVADVEYPHCEIIDLSNNFIRAECIGAIETGVKRRNLSIYNGRKVRIIRYNQSPNWEWIADKSQLIKKYEGRPYDFVGLTISQSIKQFARRLFNIDVWFGSKGKEASERLYCWEYAAMIYPEYFKKPYKIDQREFFAVNHIEVFEGILNV